MSAGERGDELWTWTEDEEADGEEAGKYVVETDSSGRWGLRAVGRKSPEKDWGGTQWTGDVAGEKWQDEEWDSWKEQLIALAREEEEV